MPEVSTPGEKTNEQWRDDENLNKRNYAKRNHKMKLFVGTITLICVRILTTRDVIRGFKAGDFSCCEFKFSCRILDLKISHKNKKGLNKN